MDGYSKLSGEGEVNDRRDEELERALRMDGTIPGSSDAFVRQVSSRAYDMRHHLHQTFDTSSYDVLEANPWREASKSLYVPTHQEYQLCTMKTRRNRSLYRKTSCKIIQPSRGDPTALKTNTLRLVLTGTV